MASRMRALGLLALLLLVGIADGKTSKCPFKNGDVIRCPEDDMIHRIENGKKRYYTGGAYEADGKPEATVDSDDVCSHRDNCKDGEPMPDPLSDGAETEEVKKKVKSGAGAADGATEDAVDELADVGTAGTQSSGGSTRFFVVATIGLVAFYYVRRVKRKAKS